MKTGHHQVDGRSLIFQNDEQPGDSIPHKFSYLPSSTTLNDQRSCHMTYTSPDVHDLLRSGFDRSPMFNGRIKSLGPDTVHQLKIRLIVLQIRIGIKFLLNQKVGIL